MSRVLNLPNRIAAKLVIEQRSQVVSTPCWVFTGASSGGYGQAWYEGVVQYVHRIAYQVYVGEIPQGLQIDHLCRITLCGNPDHLEAVTGRINTLRTPMCKRDRCRHGHALAPPNLSVRWIRRPSGRYPTRLCRLCRMRHQQTHARKTRGTPKISFPNRVFARARLVTESERALAEGFTWNPDDYVAGAA